MTLHGLVSDSLSLLLCLSPNVSAVVSCFFCGQCRQHLAHFRVELVYSLHLNVCLSSILLLKRTTQERFEVVLLALLSQSRMAFLSYSFPMPQSPYGPADIEREIFSANTHNFFSDFTSFCVYNKKHQCILFNVK